MYEQALFQENLHHRQTRLSHLKEIVSKKAASLIDVFNAVTQKKDISVVLSHKNF